MVVVVGVWESIDVVVVETAESAMVVTPLDSFYLKSCCYFAVVVVVVAPPWAIEVAMVVVISEATSIVVRETVAN